MRFPKMRTSVRVLMILVLVAGGGLGWVILPARMQREAIATIRRAGGRVEYDWETTPARIGYLDTALPNPKGRPAWTAWLVKAIGPDYFGTIRAVYPGPKTNDEDMASIGRLTAVEFLHFHNGGDLSDAGLAHLAGLPRLKQFTLGPSPKVTGTGLTSLGGASQLQFLDLSGSNIGDPALAHLKGLGSLVDLNLSRTRVTDAGLMQLQGLVGLRSLKLNSDKLTAAGLVHLSGMAVLESLALNSTGVDDLGPLGHPVALRSLSLFRCPIDDAGIAPIGHFTSLRDLTLRGTRVTDAGLACLRALEVLEWVDLEGLPITDVGLAHLEGLREIKHLNLGGTRVGDAGLTYLKGMPSLKFLDLVKTQVTDAGLDRLKGLPSRCALNLFGSRVTTAGTAAFRRSNTQMNVTP